MTTYLHLACFAILGGSSFQISPVIPNPCFVPPIDKLVGHVAWPMLPYLSSLYYHGNSFGSVLQPPR
eukprot:2936696-Ditylum_brightwellii.AAC.1